MLVVLMSFHEHFERRVIIFIVFLFVTVCDLIEAPPKEAASTGWVAIFPILAIFIIGGLLVWKRRQVKTFYDSKVKKSRG
jgi:hypothetical protein